MRAAVARKRALVGRPARIGATALTVTRPLLERGTDVIVTPGRRVRVMRCSPLLSVIMSS